MRTEYRNQRAALYEAMRGFSAVAQIGRTVTSVYQTHTLIQTRMADKARDVRDTQEDLISVQERRIRVVSDLGANNAIALRLIGEEERLTARLTEERMGLKQAQDQNIIGYIGIGLQTLQVIPTMVRLNRYIDLTKLAMGETWTYTSLSGIVTAAGAAELSILGVQTTLGSLALLAGAGMTIPIAIEVTKKLMETEAWEEFDEDDPYREMHPKGGIDIGRLIDEWWKDVQEDLNDEFGGGGGFGEGGGGARNGGDVNITVEEEEVEVQVDVTVTKTGAELGRAGFGGGGSRVR